MPDPLCGWFLSEGLLFISLHSIYLFRPKTLKYAHRGLVSLIPPPSYLL